MADNYTPRYAFVIDPRRCIDCRACLVACRAEWETPLGQTRIWVRDSGVLGEFPNLERQFIPFQCQHCENPWCVEACPTGATFQREDGLVLIDEEACIGCGFCVEACPYHVRFINSETGKADKCSGCFTRVDRGELPACVATCIGGARMFGDINDPESEVSKAIRGRRVHRLITDQVDTGPMVFYLEEPLNPATVMPTPVSQPSAEAFWQKAAIPFVKAAIALAFAGQMGAFIMQLIKGEREFDEM
ncbi:MAG TPA: 4Fe-4S dicluster domain-containing protein [Chloroflexi bacterium]|nr:4Fe-4S dicluster domain-containing protein [Chloroflexota bacterium]